MIEMIEIEKEEEEQEIIKCDRRSAQSGGGGVGAGVRGVWGESDVVLPVNILALRLDGPVLEDFVEVAEGGSILGAGRPALEHDGVHVVGTGLRTRARVRHSVAALHLLHCLAVREF